MRSQKGQKSVTRKKARIEKKDEGRKSRAMFQCKRKVKELIILANSIPPDRRLPHRKEILELARYNHKKQIQIIKELLEGVPQDFIAGNGGSYGAYVSFRNIRRALRDIANLARVPQAQRKLYFSFRDYQDEPMPEEVQQLFESFKLHRWGDLHEADLEIDVGSPGRPGVRLVLNVGADNIIDVEWADKLIALRKVDAGRLRICEFCKHIYWANKKNQVACDSRCSNSNRQQRSRDKKKQAEYEYNRKLKGRRSAKDVAKRK